jgi:hypothetical protein
MYTNDANERNRAKRQDMIGSSLSSIGRNVQTQYNDEQRLNLLPQLFPQLGGDKQSILKLLFGNG